MPRDVAVQRVGLDEVLRGAGLAVTGEGRCPRRPCRGRRREMPAEPAAVLADLASFVLRARAR